MDIVQITDTPEYDVIEEGPYSTVARMWTDGEAQWIAVKTASTLRKFTREPHDILKELRLLSEISHPNVLDIIGSFRDDEQLVQNIYMPFLPISLVQILASPQFSSHPFPLDTRSEGACKMQEEQFIIIAKSLMFQVLCAVAFLHDNTRQIAHRDIKPGNIMLSKEGCVKLIDFGISLKNEPDTEKTHDLWPESQHRLYFEVSTGPYRAPELLFGTRTYNPLAIDLWSLGATFAQFFTALRLFSAEKDIWDNDDNPETDTDPDDMPPTPFIAPKCLRIDYLGTQWTRDNLFNGERGEIGLAWSIFKIFGTPTAESWPEFDELPGAKSVVFNIVPPVPLSPLLPNLPPSSVLPSTTTSINDTEARKKSVLNLLQQFLLYPSGSRIKAEVALHHPWFTSEDSLILLPKGYNLENEIRVRHMKTVVDEWQGKSLEDLLHSIMPANPAQSVDELCLETGS
ncbi:kinase-like protein [Phlegmacium glaucopus]|nr:kinase-like protein [Phlegmacium glaucopus]